MKWFKHQSDSYGNLKHQQVLAELGLRGYGFFWVCVELIAQQGDKSRIKSEKNWKKMLSFITRESEIEIDRMLNIMAGANLIEKKALEINDLFIPKIRDYSDEYTDKVRRKSRQDRDNVVLDKIRIEENRLDKNIYGEFEKVFLTSEEHQKLIEKLGEKNTKILISELDGYIASKGKNKYSSHYATILNWARRKYTENLQKSKGKAIV